MFWTKKRPTLQELQAIAQKNAKKNLNDVLDKVYPKLLDRASRGFFNIILDVGDYSFSDMPQNAVMVVKNHFEFFDFKVSINTWSSGEVHNIKVDWDNRQKDRTVKAQDKDTPYTIKPVVMTVKVEPKTKQAEKVLHSKTNKDLKKTAKAIKKLTVPKYSLATKPVTKAKKK